MILWYSGCGNSRFVADSLAARLGEKTVFIPQADSLSFAEGEILGIVFPVYAWSVPNLVSDFLRKVSMSGRPAYVRSLHLRRQHRLHSTRPQESAQKARA